MKMNYSTQRLNSDIQMWELLTFLVKVEIYQSYHSTINEYINESDMANNALENINQLISISEKYPCAYLLMFRNMLLDKNQQQFFDVRFFFYY